VPTLSEAFVHPFFVYAVARLVQVTPDSYTESSLTLIAIEAR
jgi:hypothetical protein